MLHHTPSHPRPAAQQRQQAKSKAKRKVHAFHNCPHNTKNRPAVQLNTVRENGETQRRFGVEILRAPLLPLVA